jgi:Tfp pilus assembly protein PilF
LKGDHNLGAFLPLCARCRSSLANSFLGGTASQLGEGMTSSGESTDGSDPQAVIAQAIACAERGEVTKAEGLLRRVLAQDAGNAAAQYELGRIAFRLGNKKAAADCMRKAIASRPDNADYYDALGFLLIEKGDRAEALHALTRALEIRPDNASTLSNLGAFYLGEGQLKEALAALRHALKIDPLLLKARINLEIALREGVPAWHFPMMNDAPRSSRYDEAIRRVAPGRSILDIGTGAGLLAMMAARAGAKWVATCETVPWISSTAKDVVAANGLAERIKLIPKRSTDLQVGVDLPERVEVVVTETFGTMVINESVIPSVADALARLTREDAIVVPKAASARAYLAGGAMLERHFCVGEMAGFNIGMFNEFSPSQLCLDLTYVPHDVLSDDFEVFRFDLMRPPPQPENRVIEVVATRSGRCFGVVQWLRLELVDDLAYENRPPSAPLDGWYQMLHRFAEPIRLLAGDRVLLAAQHNRLTLLISRMSDRGRAPQAGESMVFRS